MTAATVPTPVPRKRRRWLRAMAWVFGSLIVLLVAAYFVATSEAVFKGLILPRVGKAIHARITVSSASISPFSQVVLQNLKVQTTGPDPLVSAAEVRLRYRLRDIIRGNIRVDEVTLSSPTIILVNDPDGSSNLDPILESQQPKLGEKQPETAAKAPGAKPLQIDLRNFALTDATIRRVKNLKTGARDVAEVSHVNVTLDDLKNGQTSKLGLAADIRLENPGGVLQAKLGGNYTLSLAADLKLASVKGSTRLDVTRAEGALADMKAFGLQLDVAVTPMDIKEVSLRFNKSDTRLGELRVSGPFDMEKLDGSLCIELAGIDKKLLNLAGAGSGLDFGTTTISSTNHIELAKSGAVITASGQLVVSAFQLTRTNQTTPRLDLRADYHVTVDRGQSTAVLREMKLIGTQDGAALLKAELTSPMQIGWAGASQAVGDSTLALVLSNLNLADWKPFLGEVAPAGIAHVNASLLSQQGGKQLTCDVDSGIDRLTVHMGSHSITDVAITLQASGKVTDLKQFDLTNCKLDLARQNQTLLSVSGSGTYDKPGDAADVKVAARAVLAPMLQVLAQPDMSVASGTVDLKARLTRKQETQAIAGTLTLADFTGRFGKNEVRGLGTGVEVDVGIVPKEVRIRKFAGTLTQGGNAAGSFDVSGNCDLVKTNANLSARLTEFDQHFLAPFFDPALGGKKLVSVAISGNVTAQYEHGAMAMNSDFQMANLVVMDARGRLPAKPLEAKVQLSGQVDLSQTHAIQGNLKLAADSLDLTSYYDWIMGGTTNVATASAPKPSPTGTAPATAPADAITEPAALKLPFHNFTATATIRHLYLREVDISDWQTTVTVDGGHVVVNPLTLSLNGAPVNTKLDLDMGVPGWKYDWSLSAQAIPLAPLVNIFQPESKGFLGGTLSGQANLAGAGMTGASLQKNLTGRFDFSSTNLNLGVDNIQGNSFYARLLKSLVNTIAVIPELASNPAGTVTSLLSELTSLGGSSKVKAGSLTDDLLKSPINVATLHGSVGSGSVNLQQAVVQSPAFEAQAHDGSIALAGVLTNSPIQIPISISLARAIAQRYSLAGNTPTNAIYAKLPDFLTMKGTLGTVKADINYGALGLAVAHGAGDIGSGLLHSASGLLNPSASTATNAPAARTKNPVKNLVNGLFGP